MEYRPLGGNSTRYRFSQGNWDIVNVFYHDPITIDIGGLPKGTLITFSARAHGHVGLGMPAFVNATTGGETIWSVMKLTQLPATLRGVLCCVEVHVKDKICLHLILILLQCVGILLFCHFFLISASPVINKSISSYMYRAFTDQDLPCRITLGYPAPSIVWSSQSGSSLNQSGNSASLLLFRPVLANSAGTYLCTATNIYGTDTHTVTVIAQCT